MGVLHKAYNLSNLQFFRWIYVSNSDNASLKSYLSDRVDRFEKEPETDTLFQELDASLMDVCPGQEKNNEQRIYAKDASVWSDMKVGIESGLAELFPKFTEAEQEAVWSKFIGLCKYQAMLRSCGKQTQTMEELAMGFIEKNKGALKKEDFYPKVFEEMISGGEMTQKLIKSFSDPEFMKGIVQNFGSMIQTPGQPPIDMSALAEQITEDKLKDLPDQFNNLVDQMKETGVNPFDALRVQKDANGKGFLFDPDHPQPDVNAAELTKLIDKLKTASKTDSKTAPDNKE